MKSWKNGFVCLLAGLVMFSFQSTAAAKGWAQKLGLSAAQKQQIQTIRYNAKKTTIQLRAKLRLARLDLSQLLAKHKPNVTTLTAALDKAAAIQVALKKHKILSGLKVRAVLTAKQFETWKKLRRARRRARRRRWRRWRRMRRMRRMRRWRGR